MWLNWLDAEFAMIAGWFPPGSSLSHVFNIRGLVAVVLVCLICGAIGSLVVGNRMAFFSDALAHCAFAGVALGLLLGVWQGIDDTEDSMYHRLGVPLIMVVFGILVGVGIAYVREQTSLASDTVIGVFFAGAIGIGAMLLKALSTRSVYSPENFLFGDTTLVNALDLTVLLLLALVTGVVLLVIYNRLVFTSFNASLARSRQIPLRLCNYVFIVLLALIVNLCLKTVGALLMNAMLIVPAATAANLSRNMRQMFWLTVGICLMVGVAGLWLSWEVPLPMPNPRSARPRYIYFNPSGTIVVLSVLLFFVSMLASPLIRGRQAA